MRSRSRHTAVVAVAATALLLADTSVVLTRTGDRPREESTVAATSATPTETSDGVRAAAVERSRGAEVVREERAVPPPPPPSSDTPSSAASTAPAQVTPSLPDPTATPTVPGPTTPAPSPPTTEPTPDASMPPSSADTPRSPDPTTPPPSSADDAPTGAADRTLSGEVDLRDGFTVPAGRTWAFDPDVTTTVTVAANVVVEGTLVLRPSRRDVVHTLRFVDVDETRFVGRHVDTPPATDVGLWVVEGGQLVAEGTPTAGWNRTGTDPTWSDGDDVRVAPQDPGDTTTFAPFTPGAPVPSVTGPDGSVHHAETFNLTRNVRILGGGSNPARPLADDGRAHVQFLHCTRPQVLRDVELRWLGPRRTKPDGTDDDVLGRYPLHFHHCGDGARGSVVERVVVRDSGGHAFVPHASQGVTFRDTVSFDTWESAYWWDPGEDNASHDVTFDHAAAFLVKDSPPNRAYTLSGFELGQGSGNAVRGSVVVGAQGQSVNSGGFLWPSHANHTQSTWGFTDNVAHNNRSAGIGVWQNDFGDHLLDRFVSYRNDEGMHLGSYLNRYHYRDGLSFDETVHARALGPVRFERMTVGGDVRLGHHQLSSEAVTRWTDLRLFGRIVVDERDSGGVIEFTCTLPEHDLGPEDFVVRDRLSTITVRRSDGTSFEVR